MTGFAQHYDAAVERALASDARAEGFRASSRELLPDLAAERFDDETGKRLKAMLDGTVDLEDFQEARGHVRTSRTAEELFAYFDKRR